jgi:phage tail P2-like protein
MVASVRSLLPPNASGLERAVAQVIVDMLTIQTPIATLCNPDTVPLELLPWLAWSLSVTSWKSYWPEQVKRNVVRRAIDIARHRGTAQSVIDVTEAFGGHVTIREWWQTEPKGVPRTFDLVLTLSGQSGQEATAQYVDDVIGEVRRTKPATAHFTFTQGLQVSGGIGVIAVARVLAYARLQLTCEAE